MHTQEDINKKNLRQNSINVSLGSLKSTELIYTMGVDRAQEKCRN